MTPSDGDGGAAVTPSDGDGGAAVTPSDGAAAGGMVSDGEAIGPGRPGGLGELVAEREVLICCGSGGVGKTTVSAALALQAARLGRRACVVTIDPARRLASAMGVDSLPNEAARIDGPWSGELWALMLDPKVTFDQLVRRYANGPGQAEAILGNRLYRNLTGALSGTQEYMAMEKLYELTEDGRFDVVVVDTPPTRNALDFLDAPRRLTHFLGNRLFQVLLMPTRAYLRAVSVATQALLRTISKVAGADIVQDAVAFFQAFEGMLDGFRVRAEHMGELLSRPTTAFVLVTSPRPDAVVEAEWFADKLRDSGMAVEGLVVNKVHPSLPDLGSLPEAPDGSALDALEDNYRGYAAVAAREEATFADLVSKLAPSPVAHIRLLGIDVHDVDGLQALADELFGGHPWVA